MWTGMVRDKLKAYNPDITTIIAIKIIKLELCYPDTTIVT